MKITGHLLQSLDHALFQITEEVVRNLDQNFSFRFVDLILECSDEFFQHTKTYYLNLKRFGTKPLLDLLDTLWPETTSKIVLGDVVNNVLDLGATRFKIQIKHGLLKSKIKWMC